MTELYPNHDDRADVQHTKPIPTKDLFVGRVPRLNPAKNLAGLQIGGQARRPDPTSDRAGLHTE